MTRRQNKRTPSDELKKREIEALEQRNRINQQILEMINRVDQIQEQKNEFTNTGYQLPDIHPLVVPKGKKSAIAQDSLGLTAYANSDPHFFSGFKGYQLLAIMSQSSDYRAVPETTSNEMTREWGKVKVKGDGDDTATDKLSKIEDRLKELKVRELMRKHIECEFIFGRSQLYIDIDGHDKKTDIPLNINSTGVKIGSLKGFKHIEPIWTTPSMYNSLYPLDEDFFVPSKWFVMGKEVHKDRLLTLTMRPVPDMLKPAYNFGGLSMLQLIEPYVERWQRTVDSVSELIKAFSITGLKTGMETALSGDVSGSAQLISRAQLFSKLRNNLNTMLIDKENEEVFQVNTPLTGLDNLVTKAQEQIAMPSHTPLVKLTGVTPSGLNASSDGEIRVYNDYIASLQEAHLRPQIKIILDLIQLDLFGEIDESIFFEFASLHQLTDEERATVNKTKAETAQLLISCGAISAEEVRASLANDEAGDYSGIDKDAMPDDELDLNDATQDKKTDSA